MQGISAGMEPPPPVVSVLTSLMCICLSVWTFASNGASTAALAVSGFALLSMQLLTVNKLKFSMLASSVFGLFYCGARGIAPACRHTNAGWHAGSMRLACADAAVEGLPAGMRRLLAQLLDQAARALSACHHQHRRAQLAGEALQNTCSSPLPCMRLPRCLICRPGVPQDLACAVLLQPFAAFSYDFKRPCMPIQVMLGGISHWTVGLVATFMAVACTIAADTGAYAFGKTLGRTQLISISPKKTVEGAVGGLLCSTLVALGFWRFLGWPGQVCMRCLHVRGMLPCMCLLSHCMAATHCKACQAAGAMESSVCLRSTWRLSGLCTESHACMQAGVAVGLAMLIFFASLCGDLIESVMKRDAGLKDAGDLIPGHGGLLDRFDSYIFTGAIVYFILRFVTPLFGL